MDKMFWQKKSKTASSRRQRRGSAISRSSRPSRKTAHRALLETKASVQLQKLQLRDKVCTGPKYPGKPADYSYVATEYCLPRARGKGSKDAPGNHRLSNEKEIAILVKALKDDHTESFLAPSIVVLMLATYKLMINVNERSARPDPLTRYGYIVDKVHGLFIGQNPGTTLKKSEFPRRTILQLVLFHLQS
jgi:hypothetical protein